MSEGSGNFFAVDPEAWRRACTIGLAAAVTYLVLARGTLRNLRETSWSVAAVERYTEVSRPRAKAALAALVADGLVEVVRSGKRPKYWLTGHQALDDAPSWIWLPNALIDGVAREVPPVERIRRLQDVNSLRFFVELYSVQALASDGGVDWRFVRREFEREKIGENGRFAIWRFNETTARVFYREPFNWLRDLPKETGENASIFVMLARLSREGLLECVPHLIESHSADAEVIHPCPEWGVGTDAEQALGAAARSAALALGSHPTRMKIEKDGGDALAVSDEFPKVEMVGVYRLRYRPQTASTAAWFAQGNEWQQMTEAFEQIERDAEVGGKITSFPSSLRYQRNSMRLKA